MAETPDLTASASLAEQALENLVNQFARPLDFLRELVQNSIDAGSPRVAVALRWSPPKPGGSLGVAEIHVQDFGEGMDERIIDTQLTRMFASTKEDDLTKIGKFGIGFTSIFAIRPDAVLLRTGRHGESWELLFHADRTFDKVRIDEPISGTGITLFKRMPPSELEAFVRECRWVLSWWCEHSDTPITFEDQTRAPAPARADPADPFAAFATPAPVAGGPPRISGPMALSAPVRVSHARDGIAVIIGVGDEPAFGFYNGGLTLLRTRNPEALGGHADRLGHLQFKVKSDHLEHTLTRDNVLQDANWQAAMAVVVEAAGALRAALLSELEAATASGAPLGDLQRWLAAECRASGAHHDDPAVRATACLRDHRGRALDLSAVAQQEAAVGAVLLTPGAAELESALEAEGLALLEDTPGVRALLAATWQPPRFSRSDRGREVVPADALFVLPQLVPPEQLPTTERQLVERAAALLESAAGGRVRLRIGDFGGGDAAGREGLALEGPEGGGVFQRPQRTWFRLPAFLRRRCLLVNRRHATYRAHAVAAAESPDLAALGLAQALLWTEGLEGERTYDALLAAGAARLGGAA